MASSGRKNRRRHVTMIIKETLVKGIDGFGFSLKETDNGFQTVIRLDNLGTLVVTLSIVDHL